MPDARKNHSAAEASTVGEIRGELDACEQLYVVGHSFTQEKLMTVAGDDCSGGYY